jgi:hypothetical protein
MVGARRDAGTGVVGVPWVMPPWIAMLTLPALDQSTASKSVSIATALTVGWLPSRRTTRAWSDAGMDWSSGTQDFDTRAKAFAPHCYHCPSAVSSCCLLMAKKSTHRLGKPHDLVHSTTVLVQVPAQRAGGVVVGAHKTDVLRESFRVTVQDLPVCSRCNVCDGIFRAPLLRYI